LLPNSYNLAAACTAERGKFAAIIFPTLNAARFITAI
jgi:hypothetical protein